MRIDELNRNQKDHQNKRITVTGVVRATYASPFSHFLLQDESATLIIRPKRSITLHQTAPQNHRLFCSRNSCQLHCRISDARRDES